MLRFFKRRRLKKYADAAYEYMLRNYNEPFRKSEIRFSLSERALEQEVSDDQYIGRESEDKGIEYKIRKRKKEDPYDVADVTNSLRKTTMANNFSEMLEILERNVNQSFVDRMLYYINKKGVRDSEVYKAAQVDKRLFSKMVSNREYKPSKDTAIAIALALELSLEEAVDILSRAGYTFSHSNKRDIIIEYFFREKVYNLIDINDILNQLGQKLIGRV